MDIVNLTQRTVLVPTSRGPWLAEPAPRPAEPAEGTLYVVDDVDGENALWAFCCVSLDRGHVRRARTCAFAF